MHLRRSADATAACDALHRAAAEAEPPAWLLTALRRGLSCAQGWDEVALNLRHLHAAHATAHLAPPPMEVPPCHDLEESVDFSGHDCRCMGPTANALEELTLL